MGENKEEKGRLHSILSRRKMIRNGRLWIAEQNKNEKEQHKRTQKDTKEGRVKC
jgi:hypothetical protein